MQKNRGAVVLGGDFQALGLIRSLAEKKIPVFLVDHERSISRYSRFVKRRVRNDSLLDDNNFSNFLIELAKENDLDKWVIFPNNDESVKLLAKNRNELSNWYVVSVPQWEVIKKIYYKEKVSSIAEKIGIPTPKLYRGKTLNDYLKQELEFPIVLKPSYKKNFFLKAKKKAVRVNSKDEFITEFKNMATLIDSSEIIVQEMILGGPKNLYSYGIVFCDGKVLGGMAAKRLRQHPMDFGHATTYAVSVNEPKLRELACKLLTEIGYNGIAEVEFMKDEKDGLFKFIEINGRVWGWHTLAKAAGLNLPYIIYQHLIGEKIDESEFMENVKWIRFITDIPTVFKEIINRRLALKDYFNSFRGKKEFAVFSLKDPLPFLIEYAMIPYLWYKRGF